MQLNFDLTEVLSEVIKIWFSHIQENINITSHNIYYVSDSSLLASMSNKKKCGKFFIKIKTDKKISLRFKQEKPGCKIRKNKLHIPVEVIINDLLHEKKTHDQLSYKSLMILQQVKIDGLDECEDIKLKRSLRKNYLSKKIAYTENTRLNPNLKEHYIPVSIKKNADPVSVESLFAKKKKVLILGDAGIGKSTLMMYCAQKWANVEFAETYEFVFFLSYSRINSANYKPRDKQYEISEIIINECCPEDILNPILNNAQWNNKIKDILKNKRCCIILDGFDEQQDSEQDDSLAHLIPVVRELLSFPYIICCSRASKLKMLTDYGFNYDEEFSVNGFLEDADYSSVKQYIRNFFMSKKERGEKLISFSKEYLIKKINFFSLCMTPAICEIFCVVWDKKNIKNANHMMKNIFIYILKRYLQKFSSNKFEFRGEMTNHKILNYCFIEVVALEMFAFESCVAQVGMEQNRPIELENTVEYITALYRDEKFPEGLIQKLIYVGLIKQANSLTLDTGLDSYSFTHAIFKDFLSARCLAAIADARSAKRGITVPSLSSSSALVCSSTVGGLDRPASVASDDAVFLNGSTAAVRTGYSVRQPLLSDGSSISMANSNEKLNHSYKRCGHDLETIRNVLSSYKFINLLINQLKCIPCENFTSTILPDRRNILVPFSGCISFFNEKKKILTSDGTLDTKRDTEVHLSLSNSALVNLPTADGIDCHASAASDDAVFLNGSTAVKAGNSVRQPLSSDGLSLSMMSSIVENEKRLYEVEINKEKLNRIKRTEITVLNEIADTYSKSAACLSFKSDKVDDFQINFSSFIFQDEEIAKEFLKQAPWYQMVNNNIVSFPRKNSGDLEDHATSAGIWEAKRDISASLLPSNEALVCPPAADDFSSPASAASDGTASSNRKMWLGKTQDKTLDKITTLPYTGAGAEVQHVTNNIGVLFVNQPRGSVFDTIASVGIDQVLLNTLNITQPQEGTFMDSQRHLPSSSLSIQNGLAIRSTVDFVQLLNQPTLILDCQQRATIDELKNKLFNKLKENGHPPQIWIDEIVSLAVIKEQDKYTEVLNNYLKFLQETPIIEYYHLKGLADIIGLAQPTWSTYIHVAQLFDFLKNNTTLYKTELSSEEKCQSIQLWQQLFYVMITSGFIIPEGIKNNVKEMFEKFKKQFEDENDEDGVNLVAFAKQALLRTNDDAPENWVRSAEYLGAALLSATQVAASCGVAIGTFGVTSFAALCPTVDTIKNLANAGITIYKAIKVKWNKKEWYYQLKYLQAACWAAAHQDDKGQSFTNLLQTLQDKIDLNNKKDIKLYTIVASNLIDTLTDIILSIPTETNKVYQEAVHALLIHYFNQLPSLALKAKIIDAIMTLARRTQNVAFYLSLFELMEPGTWVNLPIIARYVPNMVWTYERYAIDDNERSQSLKKALVTRLSQQFSQSPFIVAEILAKLEIDDLVKNKKELTDYVNMLKMQYPALSSVLEEKRTEVKGSSKQSNYPLFWLCWYSLSAEQAQVLASLGEKYGIKKVKIITDQEKQLEEENLHLFGKVNKMVIVSLNETGGVIINFPKNPTIEHADFINRVNIFQKENLKEDKGAKKVHGKGSTGLAAEVGVGFIGSYNKGLQAGVPLEILEEAIKLAREWGKDEDKKQKRKEKSSEKIGLLQSNSLFQSSVTKDQPMSSTSANTLPEMALEIKKDKNGEYYEVNINYSKIKIQQAKEFQAILENKKLSACCIQSNTTMNRNGLIAKLSFDDRQVAEELINSTLSCKQLSKTA